MSVIDIITGYLSSNVKVTKLADHTGAGTSDVDSSSVDMAGYDGALFLSSFGTAAANNKLTIADSADDVTFADPVALKASGTSDEDVLVDVRHPTKRYLRVKGERGTSSTLESIWCIQYNARSKAIENAVSGTQAVGQFNAPAAE